MLVFSQCTLLLSQPQKQVESTWLSLHKVQKRMSLLHHPLTHTLLCLRIWVVGEAFHLYETFLLLGRAVAFGNDEVEKKKQHNETA